MKFLNKDAFDAKEFAITANECLEKRKAQQPPIMLDLRSQEDYAKEHLIGAYNLPADFIEQNLRQLPPFGDIILYGDSDDQKTAESVKLLKDNGFTSMTFVEGGIEKIMSALKKSGELFFSDIPEDERTAKVEEVLTDKVRPMLANDGGGLQLIKLEGKKVYIQYEGACHGCPSAKTGTLNFIKQQLGIAFNEELEVIS